MANNVQFSGRICDSVALAKAADYLDAFERCCEDNSKKGLCIKVGWGHWDACVGTWGHQVWDVETCGTRKREVKDRDAGDVNDQLQKSQVNATSVTFTVREYVLVNATQPLPPPPLPSLWFQYSSKETWTLVSLSSTQGVFATLLVMEDFQGKIMLRSSR